jgi:uncharacterized protein (TIGR02246 family)
MHSASQQGRPEMKRFLGTLGAIAIAMCTNVALAVSEEASPVDFMQLHNIEIAFHKAGSTKDLGLMLSLFAEDAVLTTKGKTYTGKEQIKSYWQAHPAFQPQTEWVGYTPAFRIQYDVQGDRAHLYFECLWVDKTAGKIAAHTNSDDTLVRTNGRWLIKEMKADAVPQL